MCVFRGGGEECLLSVRRGEGGHSSGHRREREREKTRADQTPITRSIKPQQTGSKQDQFRLILCSSPPLAVTCGQKNVEVAHTYTHTHTHTAGVRRPSPA